MELIYRICSPAAILVVGGIAIIAFSVYVGYQLDVDEKKMKESPEFKRYIEAEHLRRENDFLELQLKNKQLKESLK